MHRNTSEISTEHSLVVSFKDLKVHIHPTTSENLQYADDVVFFGECFDFKNPSFSNKEIVHGLSGLSLDQKIDLIHQLSGFYTFFLYDNRRCVVINDAAGQLETYIYQDDRTFICASQIPLMLQLLTAEESMIQSNIPNCTYYLNTAWKEPAGTQKL